MLCADFDATLEFFTGQLNFQIHSIFPADNPSVAVVFGYGLRLRLETSDEDIQTNIKIRLLCNSIEKADIEGASLIAPNGVQIEIVDVNPLLNLPKFQSSFVLTKHKEDSDWIKGRADMRYRDLIPDRQGGFVIASHIHIPKGGVVPDYVHFHKVRFQMIFCKKGWAKLVYEDQGEPFVFNAGDCVLQPPEIRHRVLESSDNLEVVEVSCPAEHETFADKEMILPNQTVDKERVFNSQKFVHHKSSESTWKDWRIEGFECRDSGIESATNGLASVKVVRPTRSALNIELCSYDYDFVFMFVLQGETSFQKKEERFEDLNEGDSLTIPKGLKYAFSNCSDDLEILEIVI